MLDTRKEFVEKVMRGLAERRTGPKKPAVHFNQDAEYLAYAQERRNKTLKRRKRQGKYTRSI